MPSPSPLHDRYRAAGATFTGDAVPVPASVGGLDAEYAAIRKGVGISDLSDLGKLRVKGAGAQQLLDAVVAGNMDRLLENSIRWTAILDDRGRVVADVQVYNDFGEYLVTCARPRLEQVRAALEERASGDAAVEDASADLAAVAVEGPKAQAVPPAVAGMDVSGLGLLRFTRCEVQGAQVLLGRVGFTGEFGYVFFVAPDVAGPLVDRIREVAPGAALCGRAVQDLLRLEVRAFHHPRHVLRDETALEAGLHWMIDFRKPDFRGREAVLREKAAGLARRLVAFAAEGDAPLDRGAPVADGDQAVGYVADSARSPALGRTIGLAYLDAAYAWVGLQLQLAGGRPLETVSAPFLLTESTLATAQ